MGGGRKGVDLDTKVETASVERGAEQECDGGDVKQEYETRVWLRSNDRRQDILYHGKVAGNCSC